jgi:hypothetical protein
VTVSDLRCYTSASHRPHRAGALPRGLAGGDVRRSGAAGGPARQDGGPQRPGRHERHDVQVRVRHRRRGGLARTDLTELNRSQRRNINSARGYRPPIELAAGRLAVWQSRNLEPRQPAADRRWTERERLRAQGGRPNACTFADRPHREPGDDDPPQYRASGPRLRTPHLGILASGGQARSNAGRMGGRRSRVTCETVPQWRVRIPDDAVAGLGGAAGASRSRRWRRTACSPPRARPRLWQARQRW